MNKKIALFLCLILAAVLLTGAIAENTLANTVAPKAAPIVIALGETTQLQVLEAQAENAETVWTASDASIITVDETGMVTALNAGKAAVTAAVTTTTVEIVEKVVAENLKETNPETGVTTSRRVEKIIPEEVVQVNEQEITIDIVVESALCPGCSVEYTNAAEYAQHIQNPVCGVEVHYVCDDIEDHETELDPFCNNDNPHRVCQAGEATHECASCGQTYACEDSGSHATCIACGNAWCYKDNGNHFTPACGKVEHRACVQENYKKKDHYRCDYCGDRRCDGDRHGKGKCVSE